MAIKHNERVASIGDSRTIAGEDFDYVEVDYVTEGGIRKTLRLPLSDAGDLRTQLAKQIDGMEPERRKRSFMASLKRAR